MKKFFIFLGSVFFILDLAASLILFHAGHKINAIYALLLAAFLYRLTEDLKDKKIVVRIFLNDDGEKAE